LGLEEQRVVDLGQGKCMKGMKAMKLMKDRPSI